MTLRFSVELAPADAGWQGFIDIPMQGAVHVPLSEVVSTPTELSFVLEVPGGKPAVFAAVRDGDRAAGVLQQMGQEYPLIMYVGDEVRDEGPSRPQTPVPPFPYLEAEVSYTHSDVTIGGTLVKPSEGGPFPAALLITGSGAQDRDETIFAHKPFAVIADHLVRQGIAVLRVDDRGVGRTTGNLANARSEDLVADVLAGVSFLQSSKDIDPERVGVIGHSEGGILGPGAAAVNPEIAFVVMLAGTGVSGRDILMLQGQAMYEASGAEGEDLQALLALHAAALDATDETREQAIGDLVKAQLASQGQSVDGEMFDQIAQGAAASFASPWFQSFVVLDPRVALRKVKCPVLALSGSLDFQVPPDVNLPEIERALEGNGDVTIREFDGLNHLFQPAKTGMLDEYGSIETTFAPEVLEVMTDWIRARVDRE